MFPIIIKMSLLSLTLINTSNAFSKENDVDTGIRDVATTEMSDRDCLVYNLYHESRGESDIANIMVLNTVLNRTNSPRFPNTICGVVKQPYQYSWTNDGRSDVIHNRVQVDRLTKLVDIVAAAAEEGPSQDPRPT